MIAASTELSRKDYELFRALVYRESGINLGDEKMQLVQSRLAKRIRSGDFESFRQYYDVILDDASGEELCHLLDAISTNTTHLFREANHFDFLQEFVEKWAHATHRGVEGKTLRIWSAACSSGEEPYSIAMVAHRTLQQFPEFTLRILATDISTQMLARARAGRYRVETAAKVPQNLCRQYFRQVPDAQQPTLEAVQGIRKTITFSRFNLMDSTFPFTKGFDLIFCRNVMIYFDRATQETLVNKFAQHLHPGGYLLVGHSESLNRITQPLSYVRPTIYRKGKTAT